MSRHGSQPRAPEAKPRLNKWLKLALVAVVVLGLAVIGLRGRLPDPREFFTALAGAGYWWVALAALLQTVSLLAFAFQQRRLLAALGVRLGYRNATAITLARAAVSISLLAGAAVSTA